jgi:hypothetical protein
MTIAPAGPTASAYLRNDAVMVASYTFNMKAEARLLMSRMLAWVTVGLSLLLNLVPSFSLLRSYDSVRGDCMSRPLGQLLICIDVGLTAINLLGGCFLFSIIARGPRTARRALFWSAAITAVGPAIFMRLLWGESPLYLIAPPVVVILLDRVMETQQKDQWE